MRRIKVRLSARGAGVIPEALSFARTNRSTGFCDQAGRVTCGGVGFFTGWNAHHLRSSSVIFLTFGNPLASDAASEYGAPRFTQFVRITICSSANLYFGGILESFVTLPPPVI